MDLTIDQALQRGIKAHKAGQVQEADKYYTAILKAQPKHPDANHNMGVLAISLDKVQQALPFFKTALEAKPSIAQFWLSYIDTLISLERLADAKAVFRQAKEKGAKGDDFDKLEQKLLQIGKSKSSTARISVFDIAMECRDRGEFSQAIDLLQNDIAKSSQNPNTLALLSHCFILNEDIEKATIQLNKAKRLDPNNALVGWNEARLLLKKRKLPDALAIATRTNKRFPEDAEGMGILGSCLRANNNLEESLIYLNKAVSLNPDYAEALINRGLIYLTQGNKAKGLTDLEKAHEIKPHIKQIWNLVISLKIEFEQFSEAISILKRLLKLDPQEVTIFSKLALCYERLSRFGAASNICKKIISIVPTHLEAHINLGRVLSMNGKLDEAINTYVKAQVVKPCDPGILNNMAIAFDKKGKHDHAMNFYQKSTILKPDYADAYNNVGCSLQGQAKHLESLKQFNQAIKLNPRFSEAYSNLGNSLNQIGQHIEAIETFYQAIKFKPDSVEAYTYIGIAFIELLQHEKAITNLNKALELDPSFSLAHENLGFAYLAGAKFSDAAYHFKKSETEKSQSLLMRCLYRLDEQDYFYEQLDYLVDRGFCNAVLGSVVCQASNRHGREGINLFCKDPLKYVLRSDLKSACDFETVFVKKAKAILEKNVIEDRTQDLLVNGRQTAGNIFDIEDNLTSDIQRIIFLEIEKYRKRFNKSEAGLIKNWPSEVNLYGWLISMRSGGKLASHMHENGWISGSIYINVPPKPTTMPEAGNLVVCIEDGLMGDNERQSIDVDTGSLCLFPASLLHHTIPFQSDEERIVLAFDVIPKQQIGK